MSDSQYVVFHARIYEDMYISEFIEVFVGCYQLQVQLCFSKRLKVSSLALLIPLLAVFVKQGVNSLRRTRTARPGTRLIMVLLIAHMKICQEHVSKQWHMILQNQWHN